LPSIETTRFGKIQYKKADVITFVRPVLGFGNLMNYIIISRPESEPFKWLQSIEDSSVCFVILDPSLVIPNYTVDVSPLDIKQLNGSDDQAEYRLFGIITVPRGKPEQISINLLGPIVINIKNLKALQLVLSSSDYDIRHSLVGDKRID
jgi:flagellar assembly factor FliW